LKYTLKDTELSVFLEGSPGNCCSTGAVSSNGGHTGKNKKVVLNEQQNSKQQDKATRRST